jgi:predicted enzyme related to lactoylglutathione lyase
VQNQITSVTIGIPARDLSEATKWYRKLLGSRPEINPAPGVWEFELRPQCWLQLFVSKQAGESACVVRIGVRDIEAEHERILKLDADPSPIETVPGAVRYFEFRDPYGNRLSCYQVLGEGDQGTA